MLLKDLTSYLDRELRLADFSADHSNNGLQVEGRSEVRKAVFAVDASQAVIDSAVAAGADFIFVHHGLSWGSEPRRLTGINAVRYGTLFRNGISLYGAHLPLDAAPVFGNNACLSRIIGLQRPEPFFTYDGVQIGFAGELSGAVSMQQLVELCAEAIPASSGSMYCFCNDDRAIRRVAVVSGGGGLEALAEAAAAGADLLLTGEMTHVMYHQALESGVAVLALGHYASETVGPLALMDKVAAECGIECIFTDWPTDL